MTSYLIIAIADRLTPEMRITSEAIQTLIIFNKHTDHLLKPLLVREGKERNVGFVMTWTRDDRSGPFIHIREVRKHSTEAIESAVLNLRFFIQNNESTSLRKMVDLYDKMPIDNTLKLEFKKLRTVLNIILSDFALTFENQNTTKGEILDVMMFGEYAHHNRTKLQRLKDWMSDDFNRDLVSSQFEILLHELIPIIASIKEVNEKVLSQYATTATEQKQPTCSELS